MACGTCKIQLGFEQIAQPVRSFREYLIRVPFRGAHDPRYNNYVIIRDFFVEKVAHRIDENHLWRAPAEWFAELLRHKAQIETLLERMARNTAKPLSKCLGVAMQASGTDLCATAHRVPGRIGPFDFGVIAHLITKMDRILSSGNPCFAGAPCQRTCTLPLFFRCSSIAFGFKRGVSLSA